MYKTHWTNSHRVWWTRITVLSNKFSNSFIRLKGFNMVLSSYNLLLRSDQFQHTSCFTNPIWFYHSGSVSEPDIQQDSCTNSQKVGKWGSWPISEGYRLATTFGLAIQLVIWVEHYSIQARGNADMFMLELRVSAENVIVLQLRSNDIEPVPHGTLDLCQLLYYPTNYTLCARNYTTSVHA